MLVVVTFENRQCKFKKVLKKVTRQWTVKIYQSMRLMIRKHFSAQNISFGRYFVHFLCVVTKAQPQPTKLFTPQEAMLETAVSCSISRGILLAWSTSESTPTQELLSNLSNFQWIFLVTPPYGACKSYYVPFTRSTISTNDSQFLHSRL